MMNKEANKEESMLAMKLKFLKVDYNMVREELLLEEEKLRATQMTIDNNVVPRTEVINARTNVVNMKNTLKEYAAVHEKLIDRTNKEYFVHEQISKDLVSAIQVWNDAKRDIVFLPFPLFQH